MEVKDTLMFVLLCLMLRGGCDSGAELKRIREASERLEAHVGNLRLEARQADQHALPDVERGVGIASGPE